MTTAQTIATEKKAMSGDPPGVLAKNSIRERENKEPEKPATKKKPTNEKQPPHETESNNKNKKKCGSGKFVAERQKSMNASWSSDASSSPHGRESSSSLSWSGGRMAARRIAVVKEEAIWWWWWEWSTYSWGVIILITFNFKVKNRCAGLHPLLVSFWTSLFLSVFFFLCIFCKRVWIGCVLIWILMFSNLWNFKNWEVLMVKVLKRQDFCIWYLMLSGLMLLLVYKK